MRAACWRKIETNTRRPFSVSETARTRRSLSLSTRLTNPFLYSRSTATLTDPGLRSTFGPRALTGIGPLSSKTSRTRKSESPEAVLENGRESQATDRQPCLELTREAIVHQQPRATAGMRYIPVQ